MEPSHITIKTPSKGFVWLKNEDLKGTCGAVPDTSWSRWKSNTFALYVYRDGPSGSDRHWTITVGFSTTKEKKPSRGFCFMTSTAGWRTLQHFGEPPLQWVADRDNDGKPELIIWESFPLNEDASMAEYGLMAWVYQVEQDGTCKIDYRLSRKLAGEIATAYRNPPAQADPMVQDIRARAANALEDFASGKCTPEAARLR